jgi:hypothetical protein
MMNNLVILESPYKGDDWAKTEENLEYARRCMKDCFKRGEFPFASHLLYTQEGILDDKNSEERKLGIHAGSAWGKFADKTVVYTDMGMSEGMKEGIQIAEDIGREIEFRSLKDGTN